MSPPNPIEHIEIPTVAGPLAASVHLPRQVPAPAVVCSHGLLSSKESSKFVAVAEALSDAGWAAVRFDFSGCGSSRAGLDRDLLTTRSRDLAAVLDYTLRQPWLEGPLGLFGSSFGGYLSLLAAASGEYSIQAVVCWATPFDLGRIGAALENHQLREVFPDGFRLGNPATLQELAPVARTFILHGGEDELVPWTEAVRIYERLQESRRLLLMETADHRITDPECRRRALQMSVEWFATQGFPKKD